MSSFLLQITSGRGPVECAWVVARLADALIADAQRVGIEAELIEGQASSANGTLLSALVHLNGDGCETFVARYEGTVRWIGYSRFRSGHKRKNWFVGVQRVPIPQPVCFSAKEVKMEAMRSCGPGGSMSTKLNLRYVLCIYPPGFLPFRVMKDPSLPTDGAHWNESPFLLHGMDRDRQRRRSSSAGMPTTIWKGGIRLGFMKVKSLG